MPEISIEKIQLSSPVFEHEETIPLKYTCDGDGINPPLQIGSYPHGTKSLALIVEDPDAPKGVFDHWVVWNIEPTNLIDENENPGISGINSSGKTGYHPPCPPRGTHRYYFYLFALDTMLDLVPESSKQKLQRAMQDHILARGTLMGTVSVT